MQARQPLLLAARSMKGLRFSSDQSIPIARAQQPRVPPHGMKDGLSPVFVVRLRSYGSRVTFFTRFTHTIFEEIHMALRLGLTTAGADGPALIALVREAE